VVNRGLSPVRAGARLTEEVASRPLLIELTSAQTVALVPPGATAAKLAVAKSAKRTPSW